MRRIEGPRRQRQLQALQGFAHRRPQRQRPRRRLHALAVARYQIVTQRFAQAPQRIADRRLRQRQLVRGAREAALGHDRVKHPQQVQIQGAEIQRTGWQRRGNRHGASSIHHCGE